MTPGLQSPQKESSVPLAQREPTQTSQQVAMQDNNPLDTEFGIRRERLPDQEHSKSPLSVEQKFVKQYLDRTDPMLKRGALLNTVASVGLTTVSVMQFALESPGYGALYLLAGAASAGFAALCRKELRENDRLRERYFNKRG